MILKNNFIYLFLIAAISLSLSLYFFFFHKFESVVSYTFEKTAMDIGIKRKEEKSTTSFKLINKGEDDIEIEQIRTDCHCTKPKWKKGPIKKGDTLSIEVSFDNHTLGFFEQTLNVYLKNDKNPPTLLIFRGKIIE